MKQPVERRLAAILAADVAGYSRLMGLDEEGTAQALREHRARSLPLYNRLFLFPCSRKGERQGMTPIKTGFAPGVLPVIPWGDVGE